ncbi:conserved exported hypothetical protein [Candidatus Sulfopaludibacter sp. SbA3]|nr:conserved exported hypothetical protein [Candidatus Sulfopaludibacter sp. SbA3]
MNTITRTLGVCLITQCLLTMLVAASRTDAQEAQPVFDVADVRASARSTDSNLHGGFMRGGRYELRNATMVDLIGRAWGVDADNVVGGPGWLETDRFDVIATGPPNTTPESLRLMLQALLADRFKLVVHRDTRPFPEYVLTAGKHPQLKQAAAAGESGCRPVPQNAPDLTPGAIPGASVSCHNITMSEFAERLPRMAGDYFPFNPVVDWTELKGSWDFTLKWTRRRFLVAAGASGVSIYDAVGKQLGLKLEVQNVPTPVIAIDSVNQKPTGNFSGVPQSLAAGPAEFEVAVIKPSAPGSTQRSLRIEPGGRIDLRGFTLKALIKFAWNFQDLDVMDNDDMLVGAPKWLDTERFDIVASPADPARPSGPIDLESIHMMLRALLVDRFKLATHNESQPVSVYALVAAKPKLKKADSSNRPGCRNAPIPIRANMASVPNFSVACRNTTMAQLAERLQPMGGSYIPHPVIDSTGLDGAWDFVLSWSPPHLIEGGDAVGAAAPAARDPNGGLTLVEALDKQLGLRLKLQRRPMPVLVIDHVEQKPTDN